MAPLRIEYLPIESLKPHPRNSRTHSAEQIDQIAKLIDQYGWTNPMLVDEERVILAGHGRLKAGLQRGDREVPTLTLAGLTEEQKRALVIADNQVALNAGWDEVMLAAEIDWLGGAAFDVTLLGFSDTRLDELLSPKPPGKDPDAAPAPPVVPQTRPGDVWVLGGHRLVCGKVEDPAAMAALMQGELADVVWTDPPYNVAYESGAGTIQNDEMSAKAFREFLTGAFRSLATHMQPGASIYVAHSEAENGLAFRLAFAAAGFKFSSCVIWRKDSLVLGRSDYQWAHEPMLYGWKEGRRHRWFGGRKQTTVLVSGEEAGFAQLQDGRWQITIGGRMLIVAGDATLEELEPTVIFHEKPSRSDVHPTMKPVALVERMLRNSSRPGEIALDGFGGSGSTLIAAEILGLRARLVEIEPKFCDVIARRWQEFTGGTAVRESGEGLQ